MSVLPKTGPKRFVLGAAVIVIGAAAVGGWWYPGFSDPPDPDSYMQRVGLLQARIELVSMAAALFVCALGGYLLVRAVDRARLRVTPAICWFLGLAVVSGCIALSLMSGSQAIWPEVFHGDMGWGLLIALFLTAMLLSGLSIAFIAGVLSCPQSAALTGLPRAPKERIENADGF
jgi:drug/metabolite transporter (DMT)-like permease